MVVFRGTAVNRPPGPERARERVKGGMLEEKGRKVGVVVVDMAVEESGAVAAVVRLRFRWWWSLDVRGERLSNSVVVERLG